MSFPLNVSWYFLKGRLFTSSKIFKYFNLSILFPFINLSIFQFRPGLDVTGGNSVTKSKHTDIYIYIHVYIFILALLHQSLALHHPTGNSIVTPCSSETAPGKQTKYEKGVWLIWLPEKSQCTQLYKMILYFSQNILENIQALHYHLLIKSPITAGLHNQKTEHSCCVNSEHDGGGDAGRGVPCWSSSSLLHSK